MADTTGRIYYDELHGATNGILTGIAPGTRAAISLTSATNLSVAEAFLRPVPPPTPTVATPTTSNLTGTTVTLNGNTAADGGVLNSGIFQRGFVYSLTSANPAPMVGGANVLRTVNYQATSLPATQGANLGTFSSGINSLTAGMQYSYAAFSRNLSGYTYSPLQTFTTAVAPTVTSPTATSITATSATLGGNVTSDGGGALSARGVVYSAGSVNQTPVLGGTGVTPITDASTTTGVFTDSTGTALTSGTVYYYRAYATNSVGTSYSSVANFTTVAPPTANSQSVSVPFNTATAVTLTGSDPNTPTQTLSYTITVTPLHGMLSGTAPNLTYTPATGYHGGDSSQFTTTNTSGATSTTPGTVTVTVAAGTPTANAQSTTTAFNTAKAITLTGSDPDSPALSLTYAVPTTPAHGTLSGTTPNLTYTPGTNYQGTDSFTFTVSNGQMTSGAAMVSIIVSAGTPTANAQSITTNLNTGTAVTLTGSDPDSPALALTYTAASPANGTLSGTAPNLTYTPNTGFSGTDNFTFTASNGQKTSNTATVSITVIGEPYITGFTASGAVGSTITLTGNNFQGLTGVTFFRNVPAMTFAPVGNTQIMVAVPTGAKTGVITVTTTVGSNTTSTKFQVTP